METTWPDGQRLVVEKEGKGFLAMVPLYTDDGGHLNGTGRLEAAEQLLDVLAGALVR